MKIKIKTMEDVMGLYDLGLMPFEGYEKEEDYVPFSFETEGVQDEAKGKDRSARRIRRRNARLHKRKKLVVSQLSKKKAEKDNRNHDHVNMVRVMEESLCYACSNLRDERLFWEHEDALYRASMIQHEENFCEVDEAKAKLHSKIVSQREEAENKVFHKMLELVSTIKECNEEVFVRFDKKQIIEKVSAFLEENL